MKANDTHIWGVRSGGAPEKQYTPLTLTPVGEYGVTVYLKTTGSPYSISLYYRYTGGEWTAATYSSSDSGYRFNIPAGKSLQLWNTASSGFSKDGSNYYGFYTPGTNYFEASGNCNSLINYANDLSASKYSCCFYNLFNWSSGCRLRNAENLLLPATTLADSCYGYMFSDCTSLVNAPEIAATTLVRSCCGFMFQGCTSLVNAPEIAATTLGEYCCQYMFSGCTSLVNGPKVLPATTLANYCYGYMFSGCTSLVNAPALPSTTLANYSYQYMFNSCASLVNAPALPATTLAYSYCAKNMFSSCNKLASVTAYFTAWNTTTAGNWLSGVASAGTFTGVAGEPSSRSASTIPSNWTYQAANPLCFTAADDDVTVTLNQVGNPNPVYLQTSTDGSTWSDYQPGTQKTVPLGSSLYFRNLSNWGFSKNSTNYYQFSFGGAGKTGVTGNCSSLYNYATTDISAEKYQYCFFRLFKNCSTLISAPLLPGMTLANSCYAEMFYGCSALITAPALPATTLAVNCYAGMFQDCVNLLYSPTLPGTTLANTCYYEMFKGCTKLASVTAYFTAWNTASTYEWLSGVASAGTFNGKSGDTTRSTSTIPANWTYATAP